ncbi:MAG: hypothetical protein QF911_04495 [Candidatus Thalassarchaeaceae archaeon]|nr:hypothetical protein [Candidatus Thalassarchaeaceae archaeon]
MEPSEASWVSVEPGSVLVGSNNRSVLFGGAFFGVMTIIFWRPIQPSWLKRDGAMVQERSEY